MLKRLGLSAAVLAASVAHAAAQSATVPVTVDNFIRAESDFYMGNAVKDAGGVGKLHHIREPMPIDRQLVIRPNRDTLYSTAVFDLEPGPATITLPDAGSRFRSMQVINEDHYVVGDVEYDPGPYILDQETAGTRYVLIAVRTFVNPNDPKDIEKVHALQDAITVTQDNPGSFETPSWDLVSQARVRNALLVLGSTATVFDDAFGDKDDVDPIHHLIGTAMGWGGNPAEDATYVSVVPSKNDGTAVYSLDVKSVPVDGFWSVSVYNAQGYFQKNDYNAYSLNDVTAEKAADGSIRIQFGGCDGKIPNCLPIMAGWNYTVRLYRPREEILDGSWKFPEATPVEAAGGAAEGTSSGQGKE